MTINKYYTSEEIPLHKIRDNNVKEHQEWHPDFDYHLYGETTSLESAREVLSDVVIRYGTNFIFKKWEFCGREALVGKDPQYLEKHTFILCLQYSPIHKEAVPGCRHNILVIADSREVGESEFIGQIDEIEAHFDSISTYSD